MDESSLIRECQQGNRDAFGQVYDSYVEKIYRFIYYRTHNKAIAEDISSIVFLKALQNIRSFKLE